MNKLEDLHKRQAAVRRALAAYGFASGGNAQFMLEQFALGKFDEPPLPEPIVPPFAAKCDFFQACGEHRVNASDSMADGWFVRGPMKPSRREAIEVWNATWKAMNL